MTAELNIWKKEDIALITKMSIEGTVALASLAAAITTILIANSVIVGPAFLMSVASPVGIAALFIAAIYFAVQAYSSYQQMYKSEEAKGAVKQAIADAKIVDQVTQAVNNAVAGASIADQVTQAVNKANIASQAETAAQKVVEEKTKDLATKTELDKKADAATLDAKADKDYVDAELNAKLNSSDLQEKVKEVLPTLLQYPEVMRIFESKFRAKTGA
ncbi:hypothetical protein [Wolbachia endosymbiont of Wuchereria bancrofti]|uniref:hypothetical protein n=1 Tax=Wolbachia endosymbiont of Wuchereria bancrofti TaxID=96496 RepID=UPI000B7171F6|nr:hypothetical protein [Wolbachia endosymbiont of Wuchereria bancrofti]OWZ24975.1 hypothetical protein CCY16_00337 [Wolbachia endosymbiont of Wuchereria bancrofti]